VELFIFINHCKKRTISPSSPDRNGNPFYFSFKNKKIATDSWK